MKAASLSAQCAHLVKPPAAPPGADAVGTGAGAGGEVGVGVGDFAATGVGGAKRDADISVNSKVMSTRW